MVDVRRASWLPLDPGAQRSELAADAYRLAKRLGDRGAQQAHAAGLRDVPDVERPARRDDLKPVHVLVGGLDTVDGALDAPARAFDVLPRVDPLPAHARQLGKGAAQRVAIVEGEGHRASRRTGVRRKLAAASRQLATAPLAS